MVDFTDLKVLNGKLYISAKIKELDYYSDLTIDSVSIDTQDTFVSTGISSNPIFEYTPISDVTEVTLELNSTALRGIDVDKTLFFVYVKTKGNFASDTPCGLDNPITLGITYSKCPIYNEIIGYVKEVENDCNLPRTFINKILQLEALKFSILTGHYTQAIKYYNKFYKDLKVTSINNSCGCHG